MEEIGRSLPSGGCGGGSLKTEREHGDACLYKKRSAELSSGKWNKRCTSYRISPQLLDKTRQIESDKNHVNFTGQSMPL